MTTQLWSPDIVRLAGLVSASVRWAKANGHAVKPGRGCMCPLGAAAKGGSPRRPGPCTASNALGVDISVAFAFMCGFDNAHYAKGSFDPAYRMGADYRRRAEEGRL